MSSADYSRDPRTALERILHDNPRIFREHPDLLEDLELAPGESATVVDLAHARAQRLEQRLRERETELDRLLAAARENDRLAGRIHALTLELLRCREADELAQALLDGIRTRFEVEAAGLWLDRDRFEGQLDERYMVGTAELAIGLAESGGPGLGRVADGDEARELFGEAGAGMRSRAVLALGGRDAPWGLLVLGSSDAEHYQPGMATTYLERLAELAEALLAPWQAGTRP